MTVGVGATLGPMLRVGVLVCVVASALCSQQCPGHCSCKWKSGKQAVECREKGLRAVPAEIQPATQVRIDTLTDRNALTLSWAG